MQVTADRRCHQVLVRGFGDAQNKYADSAKIVLALFAESANLFLSAGNEAPAQPNKEMKKEITLSNGNEITITIDNRKTDAIQVQEWNTTEKASVFARFEKDGSFIEGSDKFSTSLEDGLSDEAVKAIEEFAKIEITWA